MKRCLNCMEEYDEDYDRCPVCSHKEGGQKGKSHALREGSILQGRYIVGSCLRVRGCDITYIGWDALFERKVQLQEFFPVRCVHRAEGGSLIIKKDMEDMYHENLTRFENYHRNLIRLYKESDIISVFGCFRENGTAYGVMQYLEEPSFREWIEDEGGMVQDEAIAFLHQALEAVRKVHALGLVHGAIRLSSFWITEAGKLVLKDFAEPCHTCGNPSMKDYGNVGPWIDVYGLSMLFGKMLIGWENVTPSEVLEAVGNGRSRLPVRMSMAVRLGLDKGEGCRIQNLEEYYNMIFADSVTMRLFPHGRKDSREGHRGGRRLALWSLTAMVLCLAAAAVLLIAKHLGLIF